MKKRYFSPIAYYGSMIQLRIALSTICLLLFIGSCDPTPSANKYLPAINSDFSTTNHVNLFRTIFNKNKIWTYGMLGDTLGDHFSDSLYNWSREDLKDYKRNLDVVVDTTSRLPLRLYEWEFDTTTFKIDTYIEDEGRREADFQAFPVYIINRNTEGHVLEFQDGSLFMICEALDSIGNWRSIEAWQYTHFCGNSYYELILPPDYLVVTRILEYTGEYHTQLRVKLLNLDQVVYSQPFSGRINYEQFNDATMRDYSRHITKRYFEDSLEYHSQQYFEALILNHRL